MSRTLATRLSIIAALIAVCLGAAASGAAAAPAEGTIVRATERGPQVAGAVLERGQRRWQIVHPVATGAAHAPTSIVCAEGMTPCTAGGEGLQASCPVATGCVLDVAVEQVRDGVPYHAVPEREGWRIRDRDGATLGRVTDLSARDGAVALLAAASVLCPEADGRSPGSCFDPRAAVAQKQRAEARRHSRIVPLGTHGLVWRHHVLAWNFVAQVEIDVQDDDETHWLVDHTHPEGIAPGRGRVTSKIVCRVRDAKSCVMNGPAVTDLAATCSRGDRCELVTDGRPLRRKVPATATRGPLNWIVRDSDGNRLGRVGKLGKGHPDGAVALLAATTMLCPEAAADYVGCPSPFAAGASGGASATAR
jgi:hypothetical protein